MIAKPRRTTELTKYIAIIVTYFDLCYKNGQSAEENHLSPNQSVLYLTT